VTSNVGNIARLVTAASYVAGMAFAVGAIVKFKAHKDNPTQIPIGTPIALLFVGAALIFIPTVFKVSGSTLFGSSGAVAGVSGVTSFGAPKA
jgi:intracellular multiplication protein IcmD